MTATTALEGGQKAGFGTSGVALLALFVFINYVDRGNLATAAPLIKDDLHLSNGELGILLSAFFWTYTPSQFLAGWLGERIGGGRALCVGNGVWSLATVATALSSSFAPLLGCRLALGVGESVAFPCTSKLLARHHPPDCLGRANGVIMAAMNLGPAVGTFAGGMLIARFGWRALFFVFGLASAVWLPLWLMNPERRRAADAPEPADARAPSWREIASRRELWAMGLAHFCANYAFYFLISWLPFYLVKARGFSIGQMAGIAGLLYLAMAAGSVLAGAGYQAWLARVGSATRAGKTITVSSCLLTAAALAGCAFGDRTLCLVCLFVAAVAMTPVGPLLYTVGQTLAGRHGGGKWVALQNFLGNLAGLIAPALTGFVIGGPLGFAPAFALAAGFAFLGVVGWGFMLPRIEPLQWAPQGASKRRADQ